MTPTCLENVYKEGNHTYNKFQPDPSMRSQDIRENPEGPTPVSARVKVPLPSHLRSPIQIFIEG